MAHLVFVLMEQVLVYSMQWLVWQWKVGFDDGRAEGFGEGFDGFDVGRADGPEGGNVGFGDIDGFGVVVGFADLLGLEDGFRVGLRVRM
eukprot:gene7122-biopygen3089